MVIVKRFPYKALTDEEWSNKYWFTGATPADDAAWNALFNALTAQEKTCYTDNTNIVRGYGYSSDAADAVAVWSKDMTVAPNAPIAGTLATTGEKIPGDTAAWVRWGTSRFNTKGRRIYLRKYFHDVQKNTATREALTSAAITALTAFGAKMRDGTFLDARTLTAQGETDTLVGHGISPYLTRRQLRKGVKRNP